MINTEELFKLKQSLNKFLEEHPHLKSYQDEIEKELDKAGNQHNRLVIINKLLMEKVKELHDALK